MRSKMLSCLDVRFKDITLIPIIMADLPVEWIVLLFEVVLVMIILYIATRIVTKEEVVSATYALRLFLTAILAVVIVPLFEGMLQSQFGLGILGIIIAFFLLVLIIRYIIVAEASLGEEVIESILIALITIVAIYIINWIAAEVLGVTILGGIV
jgi:hypothetical protein